MNVLMQDDAVLIDNNYFCKICPQLHGEQLYFSLSTFNHQPTFQFTHPSEISISTRLLTKLLIRENLQAKMKEKEEKRARDFIRFGKRNVEEYDDIDAEDDYENMNPSKRYGRRRISNFLRFG